MSLTSWSRTGNDKDGNASKRQAAGSEKFLMKGIQILTKLCLKNAMDIRELQAATLLTVQLPKENAFVESMIKATRAYNADQDRQQSREGLHRTGHLTVTHGWLFLKP